MADKEDYIIEGTVTEISSEKLNEVNFKISGTEGFAIKKGKKKYNVLYTEKVVKNQEIEDSYENESKFYDMAFMLSQGIQCSSEDSAKIGLIRCNALGKHIRAKISSETKVLELLNSEKNLPVFSITLLSD